jgi:Bacterial regulatory proteins, tetR family
MVTAPRYSPSVVGHATEPTDDIRAAVHTYSQPQPRRAQPLGRPGLSAAAYRAGTVGMTATRPRNASQTRADILSAARRRFATEGYEGTTLRAVAAEAEYAGSIPVIGSTIATGNAVRTWVQLLARYPACTPSRRHAPLRKIAARLVTVERSLCERFRGRTPRTDDIDMPPEGDLESGPIKAWSAPKSGMYYHGMQSVQLKTVGHTHKAMCTKFYGSDPLTPTKARLEVRQHRRAQAVKPPSTFQVVPVINPASGLTR